jgi:hypothetical protein
VDSPKSIAVPVTRRGAQKQRKAPVRDVPEHFGHDTAGPGQRHNQPVAQSPKHRYRIGQRLSMSAGSREFSRTASVCQVLALLPFENGPLRYRVRSDSEGFERIVDETDLSPMK